MSKCIEFKNSTNDQNLYFYGDIVSDAWGKWTDTDTCPEDVQTVLNQIDQGKPLNIYINSGGGSVFAGLAMYNMLKRCQSYKTVYVDGLAASIASIIAMCGDKIVMPSNSFLMIHKPWNIVGGNANDFRKMADDLDRIEEGLLNVYAEKLADGASIDSVKQMVNDETWLNASEAAKYFNIEVIQSNNAAAKVESDYFNKYNKVPDSLIKNDNGTNEGCQCQTCGNKDNCQPDSEGCACQTCNVQDCEKMTQNKLRLENLKAKLKLELINL